ncbi:MAG: cytochrome c oxidase accessory protein CcoG [Moraxella sp.]|nr:cytochrome c oxidase accessory protein CcoG [Moraxella sp.]
MSENNQPANPKKPVVKIPVHEPSAAKKRIHPRFVTGKYQNIRVVSMYLILLGFLIMPWLRWDGHQAILFNVAEPKFYIFGATFMPQDFYFFAFVFIIAAIMLFMVTVYAGRVWCGYACPQTIYVHLYQYTEKLIIGERNKRIKFDKEPMSGKKIAKLALLHSIWLIYSVITAFTFVALVAGVDAMVFNGHTPFFMGWGKFTWIFMAIITFVTYANAAYMREHMCVHICPYGRFQSVMFDKDTLIVSYDYERGEPRGARKKGVEREDLGDCVDCTMCVQVCPTGIDIRDGLQVECIQCAACIDACNDIMDKVEKPRGLIRYTTERQLVEKQATKLISFRIFAYIFVLIALFIAAGLVFTGRAPLELEIRHDRKALATVGRDGRIENSYVLKIVNKTDDHQVYKVRLDEPKEGMTLKSRFEELPLDANESYDLPVSVFADANTITERTPITITVYSTDGTYSASQTDFFEIKK